MEVGLLCVLSFLIKDEFKLWENKEEFGFLSHLSYLHLYPSGRRKRIRKQWRVVIADTWTLVNPHMSNKY